MSPSEEHTGSFTVDTSEQPADHPPLSPAEGTVAIENPPSLIWRADERAATYTVEMCQSRAFDRDVIRAEGIDMPFYNGPDLLDAGTWYWRYFAVTAEGETSAPGPVRSFAIAPESIPFPVPATAVILANMPAHPRIFATPDTLEEFRRRKDGPAKEAWEALKYEADACLQADLPALQLRPMPDDPGEERRQVFCLQDSRTFVPVDYGFRDLNADGRKANVLSFAYLISGDPAYAEAAKRWALFVSDFRLDAHLEDRAQHDTVVYCYEYGLKGVALAFDRVYDLLAPEERAKIIAHVEYHGEAAYRWCRDRLALHLTYQNSHGQQCMHALFTTALALATDSDRAARWTDYLVRQYANRIAWGNNDGGYSEGQKYSHKVQFILEALAALKTATGIDVFQKPRWRNTGAFWQYCMSLNYWWNHWGDCYSLVDASFGSDADVYIAGFLASMHRDRIGKWWSDTRVCNPSHVPLWYLSGSGVRPKPPVDVPQARLFPEVGQLAAYGRFYDHDSSRIFFRSSQWGGHSHAHCDQNGFVLHAGGEILACDAGYYTHSGDTYHSRWSRMTQAHNSILVDGEGQSRGIAFKGDVSAFFNAPDACLFIGDASGAYGERLRKCERAVLFVRPDVFVVYDELGAAEASDYTWVLNTFEAAEIDAGARCMVVRQQDQRLLVRHLMPDGLAYAQDNARPYPMKTRAFTRFTEAFPQQWNIRVRTSEKREDARILAFMHTYDRGDGPRVAGVERIDAGGAVGVRFGDADGSETALFQPAQDGPSLVAAEGIETDARVVDMRRDPDGRVQRWMLHAGTRLAVAGELLWRTEDVCDAAGNLGSTGAGAQICLRHEGPMRVHVRFSRKPEAVFQAPPCRPAEAKPAEFAWADGIASIDVEGAGETVLWVDPVADLSQPPAPLRLTVADSDGEYSIEMEAGTAEDGETVAFAEIDPREPGVYEVTAEGADFLVQDRWDPALRVRGDGRVRAPLREGVEVFARFAPDRAPEVRAVLKESRRGQIVNLLSNGGFEEGIPDYPPRGWTVQHPRLDDLGWPEWSQEGPAEGRSCLKFVRPKERISLRSRPMRLRTGGRYVLRFKAKGNATHADVSASGQRGTGTVVQVAPGDVWREYRTELDVQPGHCSVSINFRSGGDADQVLWVDDMAFGYIG